MNNYILYYIVPEFTVWLFLLLVQGMSAPTLRFLSLFYHSCVSEQLSFWQNLRHIKICRFPCRFQDFSIALKDFFQPPLSLSVSFCFPAIAFLSNLISSFIAVFLLSFTEVFFFFFSSSRSATRILTFLMRTSTLVALTRQVLKMQALRTIFEDTSIFSRSFEMVAKTNDLTSL